MAGYLSLPNCLSNLSAESGLNASVDCPMELGGESMPGCGFSFFDDMLIDAASLFMSELSMALGE